MNDFHDEDEFLNDEIMPDFDKWHEQERQKTQEKPKPSMWRLVGLVNGEQLPMEYVEAYASNDEAAMKQAVYKLCFDLSRKTKTGKHPLKKGWGKIYASLKQFITTSRKVDFWVVKINNNEEDDKMENKKNNEANKINKANQKEENNMNEKKNIDAIVAKANAAAQQTVAQKAVSETRQQYEAELAEKDAMVAVDAVGNVTIQNNTFKVRIVKDEKRSHSFNIVDENGVKVAMFAWGKALLPNITIMRNDEFGIDYMKMFPYQRNEDLVVDPDYAVLAAVIFGSEESFRKQLVAEQNRRADEQELAAQRKSVREDFFAKRNAEQMEAAMQREAERQAKLAAAKEAWKTSEFVEFMGIYGGKEISLVARYIANKDDKGNDIVKALVAHPGAKKAFARLSWNTYFGGPCLTVVMKDDVWAYERGEDGKPVIGEDGKPIVKWSKVERKHELYMAKNGDVVKKGAYGKEVAATEAEKATYTCLCFGFATALKLPQPGPKAARYPVSDEEFFAGLEDNNQTKPLRRI